MSKVRLVQDRINCKPVLQSYSYVHVDIGFLLFSVTTTVRKQTDGRGELIGIKT